MERWKANCVDPMNPDPHDEVRKTEANELPVLKKERNPVFSKDFVHVVFMLGSAV